MKVIIVYESVYGNTKKIAEAMAEVLDRNENIKCVVKKPDEIHTDELGEYDVILFGCPNHNQEPAANLLHFIDRAAIVNLEGKRFTTFDTYTGGNKSIAQSKLEAYIKDKIPVVRVLTEGFSAKVKGPRGPLADDEIQRAHDFARSIVEMLSK